MLLARFSAKAPKMLYIMLWSQVVIDAIYSIGTDGVLQGLGSTASTAGTIGSIIGACISCLITYLIKNRSAWPSNQTPP